MPWKGKQAQAIFLRKKREGGEQHAREFMHRHGNRSGKSRDRMMRNFNAKHRKHYG
jgi:hypothetical protein